MPILGKDSFGLDDGLEHDSVESSGGNLDPLPAQNGYSNRIPIRPKITVEGISLADDERNGTEEVQERSVIERLTDRLLLFRRLLRSLNEDRPLRIDLESPLDLFPALLEVLDETKRRQTLRVHP